MEEPEDIEDQKQHSSKQFTPLEAISHSRPVSALIDDGELSLCDHTSSFKPSCVSVEFSLSVDNPFLSKVKLLCLLLFLQQLKLLTLLKEILNVIEQSSSFIEEFSLREPFWSVSKVTEAVDRKCCQSDSGKDNKKHPSNESNDAHHIHWEAYTDLQRG